MNFHKSTAVHETAVPVLCGLMGRKFGVSDCVL